MTRNPFFSSFLAFLFSSLCSFAAEAIEGVWEKSDGKARVQFKIEGGKLNGYLVKTTDKSMVKDLHNPNPALRNRKILGMRLFSGFAREGDKWVGGTLYDARSGKSYKGKIWLEGKDQLRLRGYLGVSMLGQTTDWKRVP